MSLDLHKSHIFAAILVPIALPQCGVVLDPQYRSRYCPDPLQRKYQAFQQESC